MAFEYLACIPHMKSYQSSPKVMLTGSEPIQLVYRLLVLQLCQEWTVTATRTMRRDFGLSLGLNPTMLKEAIPSSMLGGGGHFWLYTGNYVVLGI